MAGRGKKKEEKKKKPTLLEYNQGYPKRKIKVGQRVDVFKVPYKEKFKTYTGEVLAILHEGTLGNWVRLRRLDTGSEAIEFIYLGKVYEGWDKPFS
jgi:hypothetical protein